MNDTYDRLTLQRRIMVTALWLVVTSVLGVFAWFATVLIAGIFLWIPVMIALLAAFSNYDWFPKRLQLIASWPRSPWLVILGIILGFVTIFWPQGWH